MASVVYGHNLTRDWRVQLAYAYRHRDTGFASAQSNTFTFRLTHETTIMP
jgi:hypothetical protein